MPLLYCALRRIRRFPHGNHRLDQGQLRGSRKRQRHGRRRFLGAVVRSVKGFRTGVRRGFGEARGRRLRQGQHGRRAGARRVVQHPLDPDSDAFPREGDTFFAGGRASGLGARAGPRQRQGTRHGGRSQGDRRTRSRHARAGLAGPANKKGQEKRSCPFLVSRKAYFFSSFFAAFLSLFFAFFASLLSPFFISSFFIGAPAWDAATAKPLDTAKTAATNSDNSFFIQRLL